MWCSRKKERELDAKQRHESKDSTGMHLRNAILDEDFKPWLEENSSLMTSLTKRHMINSPCGGSQSKLYQRDSLLHCSSSKFHSSGDVGLYDDGIEEFLHSRVKRGRGSVGCRMDEPLAHICLQHLLILMNILLALRKGLGRSGNGVFLVQKSHISLNPTLQMKGFVIQCFRLLTSANQGRIIMERRRNRREKNLKIKEVKRGCQKIKRSIRGVAQESERQSICKLRPCLGQLICQLIY